MEKQGSLDSPPVGTGVYTEYTPYGNQSSHEERKNLSLVRAGVVFKNQLDEIRRQSHTTVHKVEASQYSSPPTPPDLVAIYEHRANRRIRIIRSIHHLLSSAISLVIAIFQGTAYMLYQRTKHVAGAWPVDPVIIPTLLLFGVAVAALSFDVCSLVAYLMPGKRIAQKAFKLAVNMHYVIAGAKGLSWAIAASVCRTGFQVGNNKDLWGWSCSPEASLEEAINNASFTCSSNVRFFTIGRKHSLTLSSDRLSHGSLQLSSSSLRS